MTAYNKAIAAILMGVSQLFALYGVDIGLTEDVIVSIAAVAGPILVWAIPNKDA